jgi:transcriptional regulator with XRE-family HTH domain
MTDQTLGSPAGPATARRAQSAPSRQPCQLAGTNTVTRNEISRWERGERVPEDWLPHIARAHNIPLHVLERMAARARGQEPATTSGPPLDLSPFFGDDTDLPTRLADAWHARAVATAAVGPTLVLVGGYAGSGKTEFARFLSDLSGWIYLDKDAMTRLTERLSSPWSPTPTTATPPSTSPTSAPTNTTASSTPPTPTSPTDVKLHTPRLAPRLTHRCQAHGVTVTAIWLHSDLDTMYEYSEAGDAPATSGNSPLGTNTPAP